jgi:hypothetical protein
MGVLPKPADSDSFASPKSFRSGLKPQIIFESKAQADEKAQHTYEYVSILKRLATQLSDIRWGFKPLLRFFLAPAALYDLELSIARRGIQQTVEFNADSIIV